MRSFLSILLAVVLLEVGSGLMGLLLPVHAELAGLSSVMLGLLGGTYYLGFLSGCLVYPRTVRRVGHVRSYSAVAVIGAAAILMHPLMDPAAWFALRFVLGFSFAAVFMVIESWLNGAVSNAERGRTLGLYMASTWTGLIGGKMLFPVTPYQSFEPFTLAAVAVALSVVPIALAYAIPPTIPERAEMPRRLVRTAPLSTAGCFATGLGNGAFWTFAPLYAYATDPDPWTVGLFMSAAITGGALSQWPIGRLSDAFDRRLTLIGTCSAASLAGLVLMTDLLPLLAAAMIFGATALPSYSVFVAYANDHANSEDYVDMSSLLLLAFGAGALFGPPIAGAFLTENDASTLFVFTASVHAATALMIVVSLMREPAVAEADRSAFAAHPPIGHGTQAVAELQGALAESQSEPHAERG